MSSRPGGGGGRRRAEEHEEPEHENAERWLLSYADMITLLMALFIVLFAISQVDQAKLIALSNGLEQYFGEPAAVSSSTGILNGGVQGQPDSKAVGPTRPESIVPVLVKPTTSGQPTDAGKGSGQADAGKGPGKGPGTGTSQKDDLTAIRDRIAKSLAAKGLSGSVQFQVRDHGLVVNVVTDRVLFDAGEATLRPEGRKVLDAVAPILKTLPNELTVEGHTDNVPISGQFPSNWELSTERATTVLRYVLTRGVNGTRISASGYADQRPLSSNATAAGRARNRRVAIVVHALADPGTSSAGSASSIPSLPGD
ncbi:OmpA family protein [Pedococcus sp. KACC 23699]|uniref:OmpA family protein n=1 Tax=Pedococcus sp. KACC 23699 TaxID=3149228 RepID=A0AAU7JZC6_9MICO